MRQAAQVFSRLHTLVIHERIASTPRQVVRTTWTLVAPNRLAYRIADGSEAVMIGGRRWDRDPGGAWKESETAPTNVISATWGTPPKTAALIGSGRVGGRAVWLVSFVDPGAAAWFTLAIDKATRRTLELWLVSPAHFMHHRYTDFNRSLTIVPPR